jgi:hypothetical protein
VVWRDVGVGVQEEGGREHLALVPLGLGDGRTARRMMMAEGEEDGGGGGQR